MSKAESEKWLREFVDTHDCPDYNTLINAASGSLQKPDYYGYSTVRNEDGYLYFNGEEAHGEIPPEFWEHVEVVTGLVIPKNKKAAYFSCSC